MKRLTGILLTLSLLTTAGENMIENHDFSQKLEGWFFSPGTPDMATVEALDDASGGEVLCLRPRDAILGINSKRFMLGEELHPELNYEVSARIRSGTLRKGIFAFSVCYFNAAGKRIKQYSIHNLAQNSTPQPWKVKKAIIGPGTGGDYPEGTVGIELRFSFWDKEKKCDGDVFVDTVSLAPGTKVESDWPTEITAKVGKDMDVRFESRSFWTLYRITYQGKSLCNEKFGSHYGSVANLKGIGFIGSGHTENEEENVLKCEVFVDGKNVGIPKKHYDCQEIILRKRSRIHSMTFECTFRVLPDRIEEQVVLQAEKPLELNLFYHFMHPWRVTMSDYLAELPDGQQVSGKFLDSDEERGMKLCKPTRWSAVYSREIGTGAVTAVLESPENTKWGTYYWNVPGRYRKHYFKTFTGETIPAGREFRYRVTVLPFSTEAETWEKRAAELAADALSPGK